MLSRDGLVVQVLAMEQSADHFVSHRKVVSDLYGPIQERDLMQMEELQTLKAALYRLQKSSDDSNINHQFDIMLPTPEKLVDK